jgi:putative copper resistance protein D
VALRRRRFGDRGRRSHLGGSAPVVTPARLAAATTGVVTATVALAWALAQPALSPSAAAVRAVADGAAVVCMGLAAVPLLDEQRYRDDLMRRASGPLIASGAGWFVAELVRLSLSAADLVDVTVTRLSLHTAWEFATITAAGRSALFSLAAAALVCLSALLFRPTVSMRLAVAGIVGAGIAARAVTGHLSEGTVGATAVVVHALAAALWCGVLAALVLTVRTRGHWARVLAPFSRLSLICVVTLLAGGTAGALSRLAALSDLYSTGYGRVLLAKVAATLVLLVLAWHNRSRWVPAATAHRVSAEASRGKALTELSVMVVALALAAALTVTG